MSQVQATVVAVPGAELYATLHGSGPVLLILQGGYGSADAVPAFVDSLAGRFRVVTYDRRGQSRSPVLDPDVPVTIGTHADDADALLREVADGAAYLFGSSIGAVIGRQACRCSTDAGRPRATARATASATGPSGA